MDSPFRPPVPSLLLNPDRVKTNIRAMAARAKKAGVALRPHFKTHQSAGIGEWFREEGIDRCTVSSVRMARYFADAGWKDITIAFPFNRLEHAEIARIAREVDLGVILQSDSATEFITEQIDSPLRLYIEVNVGDHRSGIIWENKQSILSLAEKLSSGKANHRFAGVLYHAGYSYEAVGSPGIMHVHAESIQRISSVRMVLESAGFTNLEYSGGDTPTCSIADSFPGLTEIRPGNFAFYDLMQLAIGSCTEEQIAMITVCPVVANIPERQELIIYGGAVHLSKDSCDWGSGVRAFGGVVQLDGNGWGNLDPEAFLRSISQEHGVVHLSERAYFSGYHELQEGDHIGIVPAHSCLTADLYGEYYVPGVGTIEKLHLVR